MLRKKFFVAVAPLFFLLFLLNASCFSEQPGSCLDCHSEMKGRLKSQSGALIELNVDAERFRTSVHGALACAECHMKFTGSSHASQSTAIPSNLLALSSKVSGKFRDPIAGVACARCHEEAYQKVLSSVHGKNITEKKQNDGALCIDCHGSPHYITKAKDGRSPMSRKYQVETCGKCHGDKTIIEKYKLEENVMDSFKESFHGRKLHLGHNRAPVCSSCHNYHDITAKNDPASPVFGKNKLETCGKCHKGASEKFVPAMTHKRPGPIPHYGEKLLILLTIGTFAFIVAHVILEAFADIRDSLSKKKGGK